MTLRLLALAAIDQLAAVLARHPAFGADTIARVLAGHRSDLAAMPGVVLTADEEAGTRDMLAGVIAWLPTENSRELPL